MTRIYQFEILSLILILIKNVIAISNTTVFTIGSSLRNKTNQFTSNVMCSKQYIITSITFQQPFYGIIYAKGFPKDPCRVYGNGSKVIHIQTNVNECGVKILENKNDSAGYEFILYIQQETNIQQARDERIKVNCVPKDLLLIGTMGKPSTTTNNRNKIQMPKLKFNTRNFGDSLIQVQQLNNHNFTLSDIANLVECRMDVMKGRIPFLKPVDSFIDIGQDVTILIKIKQLAGIASMLSNCYAHDGSHTVKQELTDSDGCTIDANIMPNFNQIYSNFSDSKIYFTTFPAFKFPDKSNLHIQCTVVICNSTCPQVQCDNRSQQIHRVKRVSIANQRDKASIITRKIIESSHNNINDSKSNRNGIVSEIGVSNSIGVVSSSSSPSSPSSSSSSSTSDDHNNMSLFGDAITTDELTTCLTSHSVIFIVFLLITALVSSIIVACFLGSKVQELNRKLSSQQTHRRHSDLQRIFYYTPRQDFSSFSYGRMVDLTN